MPCPSGGGRVANNIINIVGVRHWRVCSVKEIPLLLWDLLIWSGTMPSSDSAPGRLEQTLIIEKIAINNLSRCIYYSMYFFYNWTGTEIIQPDNMAKKYSTIIFLFLTVSPFVIIFLCKKLSWSWHNLIYSHSLEWQILCNTAAKWKFYKQIGLHLKTDTFAWIHDGTL